MRKTFAMEINERTGLPIFWKSWNKDQRMEYIEVRARRGGLDTALVKEIIADVVENYASQLKRFKVDLPGKIQAAIADIKRQKSRGVSTTKAGQGCKGDGGRHVWDSKTRQLRKLCVHDKTTAPDDLIFGR